MSTGSFYRGGSSVTDRLSEISEHSRSRSFNDSTYGNGSVTGSMYEFPIDPFQTGMNQKLDRMVTLILEQKDLTASIQKETNDLRREVATLTSEVLAMKEKVDNQILNDSPTSSSRKKIPSQLSVSIAM